MTSGLEEESHWRVIDKCEESRRCRRLGGSGRSGRGGGWMKRGGGGWKIEEEEWEGGR